MSTIHVNGRGGARAKGLAPQGGFSMIGLLVATILSILAVSVASKVVLGAAHIGTGLKQDLDLEELRSVLARRVSCSRTLPPSQRDLLSDGSAVPLKDARGMLLGSAGSGAFAGSQRLLGRWHVRARWIAGQLVVEAAKQALLADGFASDPNRSRETLNFANPRINPLSGGASPHALCATSDDPTRMTTNLVVRYPDIESELGITLTPNMDDPNNPGTMVFSMGQQWYRDEGYGTRICSRLCENRNFAVGQMAGGGAENYPEYDENGVWKRAVWLPWAERSMGCLCFR